RRRQRYRGGFRLGGWRRCRGRRSGGFRCGGRRRGGRGGWGRGLGGRWCRLGRRLLRRRGGRNGVGRRCGRSLLSRRGGHLFRWWRGRGLLRRRGGRERRRRVRLAGRFVTRSGPGIRRHRLLVLLGWRCLVILRGRCRLLVLLGGRCLVLLGGRCLVLLGGRCRLLVLLGGRRLVLRRGRGRLRRCGLGRGGLRRCGLGGRAGPVPGLVDHRQLGTDGDGFVLRDRDAAQDSRHRRGDLGVNLVRRDLEERLVGLHPLALFLEPARDGAFGDALAQLGHGYGDRHGFR